MHDEDEDKDLYDETPETPDDRKAYGAARDAVIVLMALVLGLAVAFRIVVYHFLGK